MNFKRIKLPYKLNDLEPIIYFKSLYYHYEILHKNYEVKLNESIQGTEIAKNYSSLIELISNINKLSPELQEDIRFFGGGLINHNFYFAQLNKFIPRKKVVKNEINLTSNLLQSIEKKFGSWENCRKELLTSALKIRGSGWTWLVLTKDRQLQIINTVNQDSPLMFNYQPLIAIDVWEHAYFLDYGTNRQGYVEQLLNNLLNWKYINETYLRYTL